MENIKISDDFINLVWVEKYAPKSIDEMVLSDENIKKINEYVENKEFPNLLLCGKPGQGKTTLALNLCEAINATYIRINASKKNGIDMVRAEIDNFVSTMPPDDSLKVVILDEADGLSPKAQEALRGVTEENMAHTRFIFTANQLAKISPPLQSRFTALNIVPPKDKFISHFVKIIKAENIKIGKDNLQDFKSLLDKFYPDIRKTINTLQRCCINGKFEYDSNTIISDEFTENLYNNILSSDPITIREEWIKSENLFQGDYQFLLRELFNYVYENSSCEPPVKATIALNIIDGLKDSVFVLDQELNFYATVLRIMKFLGKF